MIEPTLSSTLSPYLAFVLYVIGCAAVMFLQQAKIRGLRNEMVFAHELSRQNAELRKQLSIACVVAVASQKRLKETRNRG